MRTHGWGGEPPRDDAEARRRILDATRECIDKYGASVGIADVARSLGVTRPTVYRYYAAPRNCCGDGGRLDVGFSGPRLREVPSREWLPRARRHRGRRPRARPASARALPLGDAHQRAGKPVRPRRHVRGLAELRPRHRAAHAGRLGALRRHRRAARRVHRAGRAHDPVVHARPGLTARAETQQLRAYLDRWLAPGVRRDD